VDSITFSEITDQTIYIDYQENTVSVINPLSNAGVNISVAGADVSIVSASPLMDITYVLSGSTTDGSFRFFSAKQAILQLNGVQITNGDGPAVNIQSKKPVYVSLRAGSSNHFWDGAVYAPAPVNGNGEEEDQKAAFFSEGQLIFSGSGTMEVTATGLEQHALASDDFISIESGTIRIHSSVNDGIHGKEGVYISGGETEVYASGDGIDGKSGPVGISGGTIGITVPGEDVKGLCTDSIMSITGGNIYITVDGDRSKGMRADQQLTITAGSVQVITSGQALLIPSGSGFDPSYCCAVSSDSTIEIYGGELVISGSGKGSKGIITDSDLMVYGGSIQIQLTGNGATYTNPTGETKAYHSTCISVNGDIFFSSGAIIIQNSGSAGKGITSDGDLLIGNGSSDPELQVTTTGSKITISSGGGWPNPTGVYDEAKAIRTDGIFTLKSGTVTINSADDAVKSTSSVWIEGGNMEVLNSYEAIESPFITIQNGNVRLIATDDGFNATHGNGGETNDGSLLSFNGGYIYVRSGSDGLDSNGNISMTGGTVVVHGPSGQPEVGMDVNGACTVSGGLMAISGSNSNMLQGPSTSSTQKSLIIKFSQVLSANTLFHIEDANGNSILDFAPSKNYYSIVYSSPVLSNGTYKIFSGGSCSGTMVDGLYSGGSYTAGTLRKTFTVSGSVTNVTF
jgi:hypothetical protein